MTWRRAVFTIVSLSVALSVPCSLSEGEPFEETDKFCALQHLVQLDNVNGKSRLHEIRPGTERIPKIVHHIYKSDISRGPWPNAIWKQSFTAWKSLFPEPEYKHIFWSDDKVNAFFRKNCPRQFKAFASEKRDIVRSDLSRYCIMWRLGGIYADLDYQPLQNFYSDLRPDKVNLVQSPYISETFQNSLMASPPHHMYWKKLMDLAQFTVRARSVLLAAGPQLLETLPLTHNSTVVHTLPCNVFQRATHTDEREKQASLRKHCKLLQADSVKDKTLKGIHWGTVSYDDQTGLSASKMPTGVQALFQEVHGGPKQASQTPLELEDDLNWQKSWKAQDREAAEAAWRSKKFKL